MIWLTWRQFRAQSVAAVAALIACAIVLGLTRARLADLYGTTGVAHCHGDGCAAAAANFLNLVNTGFANHLPLLFGTALIVVPAIIGIFWGAPLITRELETGTGHLVWNQSVSRTRWLVTKLAIVGLASMAAAGLFSLLVTWSASRIDQVSMNWLQPAVFSERGIAPAGYAAFAFTLGVLAGLLIRRTVPAMAVTLVVFTAAQFAMRAVRGHLIAPLHAVTYFPALPRGVAPGSAPVNIPGAWIYSAHLASGTGQNGRPGFKALVTYQPASRFWLFQGYETAIYLALALALAATCVWLIRRRLA
jgi:ABC-2 family transporter protein